MLYFVGTKPSASNENDRLPEFVEQSIYQYGYVGADADRNEGNYQYRYYRNIEAGDVLVAKSQNIKMGTQAIRAVGMAKGWVTYKGESVVKVEWKMLDEDVIAPLGNATNTVRPCELAKYEELYAGSGLDEVIQQAVFI